MGKHHILRLILMALYLDWVRFSFFRVSVDELTVHWAAQCTAVPHRAWITAWRVSVGQNTQSTADLPEHEVSISLIGQMKGKKHKATWSDDLKHDTSSKTHHSISQRHEETGVKMTPPLTLLLLKRANVLFKCKVNFICLLICLMTFSFSLYFITILLFITYCLFSSLIVFALCLYSLYWKLLTPRWISCVSKHTWQ